MKKFFLICAALAGALCLTFGLAGCELFGSGSSAHTHTLTHVSAQAATCTAEGNEEYWYCSECGKYFTDEEAENETTLSALTVAASGHTDSDGDGSCDECGYDMDSEQSDPPATHEHSNSNSVTIAATCTEDGVRTYICSCGDSYTETIPADGHDYASTITTEATCTTDGIKTYICAICGDSYTETISAAGHDYDGGIVTKEATCSEPGEKKYTCTVCGYISFETVATTAHDYVDGICSVCGAEKTSEGLTFDLSDDKTYYTVSGIGTCTDTNIVIPATYNNLPVTAIENSAFKSHTKILSIAVGNSVTSIGSYAFSGCSSLTSIVIPENVTSIGNYAFYNCTALTKIFYNAVECADLSLNNYVFYNAGKNGNGITVNIGANVTKIPAYLFFPYGSYAPKIVGVVLQKEVFARASAVLRFSVARV